MCYPSLEKRLSPASTPCNLCYSTHFFLVYPVFVWTHANINIPLEGGGLKVVFLCVTLMVVNKQPPRGPNRFVTLVGESSEN